MCMEYGWNYDRRKQNYSDDLGVNPELFNQKAATSRAEPWNSLVNDSGMTVV
jgi:hypothetical protein